MKWEMKNVGQKFCQHCGSEILELSKFCGQCGAPLEQLSDHTNRNRSEGQTQMTFTQPFWKKYKWIWIGLMVLIIGFILFTKKNVDPEEVATDFVNHATALEVDEIYDMLAVQADQDLIDEMKTAKKEMKEDENMYQGEMAYRKEIGAVMKSFEVTDKESYGKDNVVIYGDVLFENDEVNEIMVELIKEKGKWMVKSVN